MRSVDTVCGKSDSGIIKCETEYLLRDFAVPQVPVLTSPVAMKSVSYSCGKSDTDDREAFL